MATKITALPIAYRRRLGFLLLFFLAYRCPAQLVVHHLRTNDRVNPCGLDTRPDFSWQLTDTAKNTGQTAWELRMGIDSGLLRTAQAITWQTGKRSSARSLYVPYSGPALIAGQKYFWQVRVWDNQGRKSSWSRMAFFQMDLLHSPDWKARWITAGATPPTDSPTDLLNGAMPDSLHRIPPIFLKRFSVSKKIQSAWLYITAHGLYEARLNRSRVGDAFFTPGWTSYDHRLQLQCYEVTEALHAGPNELRVTIGDGWWRGVFGGAMKSNNYGSDASLLCQLQLYYDDGSQENIGSDGSWLSGAGPIRYADLYNGEIYDARRPEGQWTDALVTDLPQDNLVATISEPVRKQERFSPIRIFTDPAGEQLVDFGQNISGWVRFRANGTAGDTVKIDHAEALDKQGNFYTGNLREARAEDVYILGNGPQHLAPHFTFHGFRYIRIKGYPGPLLPENFTAMALYSALDKTGSFACSDSLLNRLQENIVWSQQDNFLDLPTDCPQRSERYGWTGDAQIFARTASYNRNVLNFFSKWLKDLGADQGSNGGMPVIIPDLNGHRNTGPKKGVAGWGDAATIVPWTLFRVYGDTVRLAEQYPSMKAWVDYIESASPGYCWKANGYGDWLAPDSVQTPVPFISQCYYFYSSKLLSRAAGVLHKTDDSLHYAELAGKVQQAFLDSFTPLPATQTAQVLPLSMGLLPDSLIPAAVDRLVELVHAHQDHLSTGFLGTPALLPVLTKYGHTDLAYKILLQDTPPSWLYPVKMGATTIWEKWDAILPDGTVGEKSLNHYSYGAVGDWLYRTVAGISELEPGYKKIRIAPEPGGGLTWVKASYNCPYGKIVSNWRLENGKMILDVEIPANTTATVQLPGEQPVEIGSGKWSFQGPFFVH